MDGDFEALGSGKEWTKRALQVSGRTEAGAGEEVVLASHDLSQSSDQSASVRARTRRMACCHGTPYQNRSSEILRHWVHTEAVLETDEFLYIIVSDETLVLSSVALR